MKNLIVHIILGLVLLAKSSFGQIEKNADENFEKLNYQAALKNYLLLVKKDTKNPYYNYRIGFCYLHTNIDKTKSIPYLEEAVKQEKFDQEALFYLGKAYHSANRFDEAIAAYTKYVNDNPKGKNIDKIPHSIEMCNNGKELIKHPVNVTFTNIGKEVNSEYADYYPWIPADESFVAFTSRRKGNVGNLVDYDGYYTSDVYISEVKEGSWMKAKNAGAGINTADDEQVVGLTSDGKTMLIYIDHQSTYGDLYFAQNKGKNFGKPEPYGSNVNSKSLETAGSITSDGNILLFASDKPGGFGGTDIYMSKKLPTGEWGEAFNLGENINTKYNEEFPHLSEDNGTLYFASEGHNSMGGYDIFKSVFDEIEKHWQKPANMGYPINTTDDNLTFCVGATNRDGYVSALRPEGNGDLDIYKVTFNEIDERVTVLRGKISTNDSIQIALDATITITDLRSKMPLDNSYKINGKTNRYVIALPAGEYSLTVEADGYENLTQEFKFYDKSDYKKEIIKDLFLLKKGTAAPTVNNTPSQKTVPVNKK